MIVLREGEGIIEQIVTGVPYIGETEEEMLYIPEFAKEIRLDSIRFHKLRIEKFSPLKEVVEATPGYYFNLSHIGGSVYLERYGHVELKRIRNKIRSKFYDPGQIIRIIGKAVRVFSVGAI